MPENREPTFTAASPPVLPALREGPVDEGQQIVAFVGLERILAKERSLDPAPLEMPVVVDGQQGFTEERLALLVRALAERLRSQDLVHVSKVREMLDPPEVRRRFHITNACHETPRSQSVAQSLVLHPAPRSRLNFIPPGEGSWSR